MSEFGQNLKNMVLKGIEAIGNTAGNIASSTKQKVEEFNLSNEMKELYAAIGEKVYAMAKEGVSFPDSISEELKKACETEKELLALRENDAEETGSDLTENPGREPEEQKKQEQGIASEYTAEDDNDVPVLRVDTETDAAGSSEPESNPLSSAINDLFEKMPPVDKMVDKVNTSLDDLGDSLRKFSGEFDKQLNDFAEQMMGKNDKDQ